MITMDFETRSACDIRKAGSYQYSMHPTTSIMCLAWAYDDDEPLLWHPAYPKAGLPERGRDDLEDLHLEIAGGAIFEAHNAFFERCIWTNVGTLEGWPELDPRQIRCSAAKAASFALPRSLEGGVAALGLPFPKDMAGNRLMLKLAKPRKPRIAELRAVGLRKGEQDAFTARYGHLWHESDPEELGRLFAYCQQDVRAERALSGALRDLSPFEQEVWHLDQEMNWHGVYIDRPGVEKAIALADTIRDKANEEMNDLTFGAVERCTKREAFKTWCAQESVYLPDTTGLTIDSMLEQDLPDHVARALSLWKTVNKTSLKKYEAMVVRTAGDSRVRDILRYHAATTGRWGGVGIQPQNFPRGSIKDMDEAWKDIHELSLEQLESKHGDVMELLSGALRGAIMAAPGNELVVADYASIEARGLFWMAGATRALGVLHAGQNIYKDMTGAIMEAKGTPIADPQAVEKGTDEYQLGKQAILGLGYQMGGPKFVITCAGYGMTMTQEFGKSIVQLYRGTYPEVPKLWYAMEEAAIEAVKRGPRAAEPVTCKYTKWAQRGRFLHCRLPGGRLLSYCDPRIVQGETPWGAPCDKLVFMGIDTYSKKWSLQKTYGGKLVENVIQALSRDLMAEAMLRCVPAGYRPILTVHDEIVAETKLGEKDYKEFEALMSILPPWAENFPVEAEGWQEVRYRK